MREQLRSLQVTYKFTTSGKRFGMKTVVMEDTETVREFMKRVELEMKAELP